MPVVSTISQLNDIFADSRSQFLELWVERVDTSALCALVNGELGWLMYLRENGDSGFSSRNPDYDGPPEATIRYRLENGQVDEYPASWALPRSEIQKALAHFITSNKPPSWLAWHNDSDDGTVIGRVA